MCLDSSQWLRIGQVHSISNRIPLVDWEECLCVWTLLDLSPDRFDGSRILSRSSGEKYVFGHTYGLFENEVFFSG